MKLPNWFKIAWWVILLILTTTILYKRYDAITSGLSVPADVFIFMIFVALMLVPIFSEFEFFGIKLKKEIDDLKNEVNVKIGDLKNDIRIRQVQNIHINDKQKAEGGQKNKKELLQKPKTTTTPTTSTEEKTSSRQNDVDLFIECASVIGLYALYAVHLSKTQNKPFNIKKLCSNISLLGEEYTTGFLIAASSFGLFSRANYSDLWEIVNIDKYFDSKISEVVINKAKEEKETEGSEYLYEELQNIENFFKNIQPPTRVEK